MNGSPEERTSRSDRTLRAFQRSVLVTADILVMVSGPCGPGCVRP